MKDYPLPKVVYVVVYPDEVRREYLPMVRQRMEGHHQPAAMLFSHTALAEHAMICSCPFGHFLRVKSPDELLFHLDVFEHLGLNCITFDPIFSDADCEYEDEEVRLIFDNRLRLDDASTESVRQWIRDSRHPE